MRGYDLRPGSEEMRRLVYTRIVPARALTVALLLAVVPACARSAPEPVYCPSPPVPESDLAAASWAAGGKDAVPNAETAIRIAMAVWTPIYGAEMVEVEAPFDAKRAPDGSWFVCGTMHCSNGLPTCKGGVLEAWIARRDGQVLRVTHGK